MSAPTITPEQIADLLDRAAARIERYGHVKESLIGGHPYSNTPNWKSPCCADGAIQVSVTWDLNGHRLPLEAKVDTHARIAFGNWLIDHDRVSPSGLGHPWEAAIWSWNDAEERTAAEVVAALRECAADARAEARTRAGGDCG